MKINATLCLIVLLSFSSLPIASADENDPLKDLRGEVMSTYEDAAEGVAFVAQVEEKIKTMVSKGVDLNEEKNKKKMAEMMESIEKEKKLDPKMREYIEQYYEKQVHDKLQTVMDNNIPKSESETMKRLKHISEIGGIGFDGASPIERGTPQTHIDTILKEEFVKPKTFGGTVGGAGDYSYGEMVDQLKQQSLSQEEYALKLNELENQLKRGGLRTGYVPPLGKTPAKLNRELTKLKSDLRREENNVNSYDSNADYYLKQHRAEIARGSAINSKSDEYWKEYNANVMPHDKTNGIGSAHTRFQSRHPDANIRSWEEKRGDKIWTIYLFWGIGGKTFAQRDSKRDAHYAKGEKHYQTYLNYFNKAKSARSKAWSLTSRIRREEGEIADVKRRLKEEESRLRKALRAAKQLLMDVNNMKKYHELLLETTTRIVKQLEKK